MYKSESGFSCFLQPPKNMHVGGSKLGVDVNECVDVCVGVHGTLWMGIPSCMNLPA